AGVPGSAAAVTVEVDCVAQVGGGDERGLAHGASPGTAQASEADVTALQNLQGCQQLGFGELRAAPCVGQGGQRTDDRVLAHKLAEAAFHAPDGYQGFAVDTVALLNGTKRGGMLGQQRLSAAQASGRDGAVQVLPHRPGELRLGAVGPDYARVRSNAGKAFLK